VVGHLVQGASAVDAKNVLLAEDGLQQLGGGLCNGAGTFVGGVFIGHDDIGVFESELPLQLRGQLHIDGTGVVDGDLDHAGGQRFVEFTGHLEPGDAELLGDLDPRAAFEVVAARDDGALEQFVRTHPRAPFGIWSPF